MNTEGAMGRSKTKYVVNPDTSQGGASSPFSFLSSTVLILTSFLLYLLDQGTDALTALLYFLDVSDVFFIQINIISYTVLIDSCQVAVSYGFVYFSADN